jgi:thymidylate synthase (FAD)
MIRVDLIDTMGSDLSVVNSARVSFSKMHKVVDNSDRKLIKYLAENNHWSPFAHTSAQFYIHAPIFVARQLAKHQIGLAWNEVSRRYVSYEPKVWRPADGWREACEDKKQGSSDKIIPSQGIADHIYDEQVETRSVADQIGNIMKSNFPLSWRELTK